MLFLVAALAAPAIGPALYGGLHSHPKAVRLVDGFVYLAVPLLVAWQVVPFAREDRGLVVPLLVLAGLVLPNLFERASRAFEAHTDNFAIIVGLSGLALHALLEGAALGSGGTVALAFGAGHRPTPHSRQPWSSGGSSVRGTARGRASRASRRSCSQLWSVTCSLRAWVAASTDPGSNTTKPS